MIEGRHQRGAGLFENAGGDGLAAFPEAIVWHDASAVRTRAIELGTRRIGGHHDRSEERRVGKEWRSRWAANYLRKKQKTSSSCLRLPSPPCWDGSVISPDKLQ